MRDVRDYHRVVTDRVVRMRDYHPVADYHLVVTLSYVTLLACSMSSSPFSSVVCSTVTEPPTGLEDILQRIQSDPLRSCKRTFFLTRLRVYAIKKSTGSKNESGFSQSRVRVNVA